MSINKERLGIFIGHLLVAAVLFGVPYLMGAFLTWDINAANWSVGERAATLVTGILLFGGFLFVRERGSNEPE
jgi:hypothetical protein